MLSKLGTNGYIEQFVNIASEIPDDVAIEFDGEGKYVSYGELLKQMEEWRGCLDSLRVSEGEMVLILLPNGTELIASFYALTASQAIAIPSSYVLTKFEVERIIYNALPVGVITTADIYRNLKASFKKCMDMRFVIVVDQLEEPAFEEKGPKVIKFTEIDKVRCALESPKDNPIVSCHYTYKGSGYPLGATHHYDDYNICIEGMNFCFPQKIGAVHLVGLPVYPVYGLTTSIMFPLNNGCKILFSNNLQNKNILGTLIENKVTYCGLVPILFKKLVAEAKIANYKKGKGLQSNLRLISGASFLERTLAEEVKKTIGLEPYQGYGLTETLPLITNYIDNNKLGSLGKVILNTASVKIMDVDNNEAPIGQIGEITLKGPAITRSYYKREKETKHFLPDGRLYTGDLGYMDEEGYLHFVGRRNSITKIASQMVDLVEIETVLKFHPDIKDAKVWVKSHPTRGKFLTASVILEKGSKLTETEVKAYCKKSLSRHKVPSKYKICDY